MNKKILIVSARIGMGHVKCAEAIENALKITSPQSEIKRIDILDSSKTVSKFIYSKIYPDILKIFPEFYAYNYRHYGAVKNFIKLKTIIDKLNPNGLLNAVNEFSPDIIITTHYIAAAILTRYKKINKKCKLVITLTDYEFHPLWLVKNIDLFLVATEEIKHCLILNGINEKRIEVSGIPINPIFAEKKNKSALRKKYALEENLPIILVSSGSLGITPLCDVIKDFKKIKEDFQMIIICGENEKLLKEIKRLQSREKRIRHVLGFTNCMDELMAISNIFITKPGGVTTSESLAMTLPMILINPIPGQEEANADYLIEHGTAIKARNLSSLIFKIGEILKDKKRLEKMGECTKKISKPNSAEIAVKKIISL